MNGIFANIKMSATQQLGGGILALFFDYLLKIFYLLPMIFLWRAIAAGGADLGGFTLEGLLTYTCVSSILSPMLNVQCDAVSWRYDGVIIDYYRRPQTIMGQLVNSTVGKWIPELMLYGAPLTLILLICGVNMRPATLMFVPCLVLAVSLGFAVDFLFTCFIIRLKNATWMAHSIRSAVTLLFSGAVIPFALLPFGIGRVFALLPFGSLAAAPLAVYAGMQSPLEAIGLQLFWSALLWPLAILAFAKNSEWMVSYGG